MQRKVYAVNFFLSAILQYTYIYDYNSSGILESSLLCTLSPGYCVLLGNYISYPANVYIVYTGQNTCNVQQGAVWPCEVQNDLTPQSKGTYFKYWTMALQHYLLVSCGYSLKRTVGYMIKTTTNNNNNRKISTILSNIQFNYMTLMHLADILS